MDNSKYQPDVGQFNINSIDEFISAIKTKCSCGHWLFRGLSNSNYQLIPSLARENLETKDEAYYEFEMKMIRRTFGHRHDQTGARDADINQLLLAQHHGAPTRLMDWTSSALVAAHFASVDVKEEVDFTVWAMHACPMSAGGTYHSVHDIQQANFYANYIDYERNKINKPDPSITIYPMETYLKKHGTIVIQGSDVSPRVAAQQGYVSIQRELRTPLERQASDNITHFRKFSISKDARSEFQEVLFQLGIRRRSLFPDEDGLFSNFRSENSVFDRLLSKCNIQ